MMMGEDNMANLENIKSIENDFIEALEAITPRECQFNYRLLSKTKKVAALLGKLAHIRKDRWGENQDGIGGMVRDEENREYA